ncbi:MAG: extracellular solute-binding protein [Butyrivibrio sp.]|nr:extracellular solute-binding protein [Butyrivibrio sp.]
MFAGTALGTLDYNVLASEGVEASSDTEASSEESENADETEKTSEEAESTDETDETSEEAESTDETEEASEEAEDTDETTETSEETESTDVADATTEESTESEEYSSERLSSNYSNVSAEYTYSDYTGDVIDFQAQDTISDTSFLTSDTKEYEGAAQVADLSIDDTVELKINVPQDGLYLLQFNYLSYDESILPIELAMQVDGTYPFYECRNMELETTWQPDAEPSFDRYNNQVVTVPNKLIQWENQYLLDSSYRHSAPLKLQLSAGEHVIKISVNEGNFLLGGVSLVAPYETPAYTSSTVATGSNLIELQGENFTLSNDSSIHGVAEYDTSLDPYEVTDTVLNTIDSDSFDTAGQMVSYEFEAPEEGDYYLALNYRQSEKTDFPVFVDVRIDGEIPNTEFEAYPLAYSTKYRVETLEDDDGNNLSVHLTKGTHTISYTISMNPICNVMEQIDVIMSGVNDLALEITKVAGTNSDKYRDLKLSRYIPGLEDQLYSYAEQLEQLEKDCLIYSDSDTTVAVMSSLIIAAKQLRSLADNPDEIPYRIGELSTSTNSVNHYLATAIDNLIANDLAIDRLYIYQEDAKLPGRPNIFASLSMNISRFIASYTEKAYSTSNTDPEHLQVWVNRSSQYIQIMQKMIDEYFTPETGIEVDISIMPDQYKLVLANSSGNAPDVATGINYTIPYELAVRGALVDMTQFGDFQDVAAPYEPGYFMTGTIGDSVYSMPETTNFWVLFYRTDIMDKLGLEVPQTMTDVIDMLPDLQMRGLNFYYPTAGMIQMRNFHGTTPLIMQNGGSLYYGTASQGTALGSEAAVEGFTELTELFTIYDLDVNIDNYYQHFRNGDLPIGIADYAAYNLLTNAAPELASSWEIALAPGTLQEDGTIDRSTCGCAESSVIFKSDSDREEKAWQFVKWWSSTEVQAEFGQTLQITYGDEYMWPTANMEALAQLPWDTDDKEVIMEFAKNVKDIARVPGTYLLEREMSNAFNDIVVNGSNEQTRIDEAVKNINREFDRKLEEFGFNDSEGNVIEEYEIPTYESECELLGRSTED